MTAQKYWVYILRCERKLLYTGYTNNLDRRFNAHVNGTSKCKFTKSFKPISIAQSWQIDGDKVLAMKIERYIKKLSREEKERLITHPEKLPALSGLPD